MVKLLLDLVPHSDFPPKADFKVGCAFAFENAGNWKVNFTVDCSPENLSLPQVETPQRQDDLWTSTCFELFVLDPNSGKYLEFNLAPSGSWATYEFAGYRQDMRAPESEPIAITATRPNQFRAAMRRHLSRIGFSLAETEAVLENSNAEDNPNPTDRFSLAATLVDARLNWPGDKKIGLSAVIEEADGTKSYWALAHPAGEPDFHDPACFAVAVPAAKGS